MSPAQQETSNPRELTGTLGRKAGASFSTVGAQFKVLSFPFLSFFLLYFAFFVLFSKAIVATIE